MKHLPKIALLPFSFLSVFGLTFSVTACGCSGQTLDGGSNASGSSGATSPPPTTEPTPPPTGSASGGNGATTIPDKPIEGKIAGKPFAPKSVDLELSKAQNQWFLALRNYATDCRTIKTEDKIPGEDALIINIGGVTPEAGTFPIVYADKHAATFQVGVYEANGPKPDAEPAKTGTLRLDTWSDTPGTTITGALKLSNDESEVAGTFTAKICPAR